MSHILQMLTLCLALSTASLHAAGPIHAEKKPPPLKLQIKHGYRVSVEQYDETKDVFLLSIVEEPGVGPNYATADNLAKAIDFQGDKKAFARQRGQMIGSVYLLSSDLPLIEELKKPTTKGK